jgi:single-strand DNA-binding protein
VRPQRLRSIELSTEHVFDVHTEAHEGALWIDPGSPRLTEETNMNDDTLTILGRVATDPTLGRTASGIPVVNFRMASTHRRFDQASQRWVDAGTNWYSVAAFRQLGEHAKASLRTGDSVIVTGRLKIRNWEANGKHGTSVDLDAEAIGHDLRWGTSAFLSASRLSSAGTYAGAPAEPSATRGEYGDDAAHAAGSITAGGSHEMTGVGEPGDADAQEDLDVEWAAPTASVGTDDESEVEPEPVPF